MTTAPLEDQRMPVTPMQLSPASTYPAGRPSSCAEKTDQSSTAELADDVEQQHHQRDVQASTFSWGEQHQRGDGPDPSPSAAPVARPFAGASLGDESVTAASGNVTGTTSTPVPTSFLAPTRDIGEPAVGHVPFSSAPPREEEVHETQARQALTAPGNSFLLRASLSRENSDASSSDGSAREHSASSRFPKLGCVPTPPFNTPAASSPSVAATAEQNLASILSEDFLKESVLASACPSALDAFDQARVKERESEESSKTAAFQVEGAERRGDDESTREEESFRNGDVLAAGEVETETLKILTEMLKERSKFYEHDVIHGVLNNDPATFFDDGECDEVTDEARTVTTILQPGRSGPAMSHSPAVSGSATDDTFAESSATYNGGEAEADRETQALPAGTVLSQLVDAYAAVPVTPTSPVNATDATTTVAQDSVNVTCGTVASGILESNIPANIDNTKEANKRVSFEPSDDRDISDDEKSVPITNSIDDRDSGDGIVPHESNTHELGTAGTADNANLKRSFNHQNSVAPRFAAARAGDALLEVEKVPEMLGGGGVPTAGPDPGSPSTRPSALSSASTIAMLSGVVASKVRGETHPTEPHKSPKRTRYDAHGRGAFIPVSDDEVDSATTVDEVHDDDEPEGARGRERERPVLGALGTDANVAATSKETLIKSLDILMPGHSSKIASTAEGSFHDNPTPYAAGQAAEMPATTMCEPLEAETETASAHQERRAGGLGLLNVVKNSAKSVMANVVAKVQAGTTHQNLPRDLRNGPETVRRSTADAKGELELEPEHSPLLRHRRSADAQPKASIRGAEASRRAKTEVGRSTYESWTMYALTAVGSTFLVYVIVPLVVKAVTAA